MRYGFSFGIAFAASLVLTFAVRTAARRLGLVAKPRADRWHRKPTALFGGVGICAGFFASYLLQHPGKQSGDALFLVCAGAMFVLGLIDDFIQLKPYTKLIGQIVICTAFTMFGMRLHWLPSEALDQVISIFWLVGITNALNLLDNLDGLAGGVGAIAAAYLVYFCHVSGQPAAAALAAALCGGLAAFLVFNFNPASVFMGDCGSLFLGFFLGGITMINNQFGVRRNIIAVLSFPVLLLLIPIVDTTLVTLSRRINGRRVSQGGRDHTSHRLVALGLSERLAAFTLWALAAASGAVAVMVRNSSWVIAALLVPLFGLALTFFVIYVGRVKVYQPVENEREGAGRALLPTLADFTYKRRIFEVLNDLLLIVLAYYGAFVLRFDGALTAPYYRQMVNSLPLVIVIQIGWFLALGLYQGLWRYTSMSDLSRLIKAVAGAWIATMTFVVLWYRMEGFSRGMLLIDGVLLLCAVAGSRVSFRLLRTWLMGIQPTAARRRVLIYGAGDAGELLLRELQNNVDLGLHPVGFVDDDPQKHGRVIHGVRVLGSLERLKEMAASERAAEVVVSTAKLDSERAATLAFVCQTAGIGCRRLRIAVE